MKKVILITGAAKGIGLATATFFAERDWQVVMNVHHPLVTATWDDLKAHWPNLHQVVGDVSDATTAQMLVKQVQADFGQVDALVNNAGMTRDQLLMRMSAADFEAVLKTNLVGTFNMTQAALKIMQRQRAGAIVNVASVVGLHGNIGQANYAASKAGIIGLTKTTALEGARRQVRCNAIAPGMITTAMTAKMTPAATATALAQIPLARFGEPNEVAQAIYFLVTQPYLTGQVLTLDGGLTI